MQALLDSLNNELNAEQILLTEQAKAPYLQEWRGKFHGQTLAVVKPNNVEEVAAIVRHCARLRVGIVPQGGNTGACGGAAPSVVGDELLLSLDNLNRIRVVHADDFSLVAEAGCTLAAVQQAARAVNRRFALDIAAAERCQIGGNLATNCGGVNVLRYGNVRAQCFGLEAVLPNGDIWHGLSRLHKDNRGYDLKDLLIGSEGTLGVITAASLKLFSRPIETHSAWVPLPSPQVALRCFTVLREQFGDAVSTCELMPQFAVDLAVRYSDCQAIGASAPWYLLIELEQQVAGQAMRQAFQQFLHDYNVAPLADVRPAWQIRKSIPYAQRHAGGSIKHDVSVPVQSVPDFLMQATAAVETLLPGIRVCAFGHLGDGNIHFNLTQPEGADKDQYLARWDEFNELVHAIVADYGGSFAAEHGVGQLKAGALPRYLDPTEWAAMQAIKQALDPLGIMNPGKVLT